MKNLSLLVLTLILVGCYQGEEADLIIHNAKIYSCDKNFTTYEAMAIRDGKILQMGPEREIMNGYDCDNIIDAEKKAVYPGLYDAHCHFKSFSDKIVEVDMNGTTSWDDVVSRIVEYEKTNDLPFITGRGWDQSKWEEDAFPTNDTLNVLFPNKPVLLRRVDGHAALANDLALQNANITAETKIEGGFIEVVDGQLTGILLDNAFDTANFYLPDLAVELQLQNMQQAEYALFQVGLTSLCDAGIESKDRQNMIDWYSNGDLSIRSYAMLFPEDDNLKFASDNGHFEAGNLSIKSFKMVADGAMGSWGACLIKPYSDDTSKYGIILRNYEDMLSVAELARELNYQVNTHCIGDSANRMMLRVYEQVIQDVHDHRWRIEHAQFVDSADFKLFQELKVIPSVQPTHCTSDMHWVEDRLGKQRAKFAYAYKTLLKYADRLALGTDFPIEGINPMNTFYAAVSRQDASGYPEGGFYPGEALSRKEALWGMTLWAAYSNFEETKRGSLEEGKDADFIIMTKDIMVIPESEILSTHVERTYLGGREVYYSD